MAGIGDRLREARLRQEIDVAEVEAATKIRAKYVRAMENEEWDVLPGSTYVRSFMRTYADYLGLDARMLVEEYRTRHERAGDGESYRRSTTRRVPRGARAASTVPARRRRPPRRGFGLAVGLAVVVLGLLGLGLLGASSDPGGGDARETTAAEREVRAERRREREAEEAREARAERRRARRRPRVVSLRITPQNPVYVCIDVGENTRRFEGTMTAPMRFRHARRVAAIVGQRSAGLAINGDPVEVAPGVQPLYIEFERRGRRIQRRELSEAERPCR